MASISTGLMTDVIGPLGYALTALSEGRSHPGKNAGTSFRFTRNGTAAPHQTSTWTLFVERMNERSAYCGILEIQDSSVPALARVKSALAQYANQMGEAA